jgi:type IV pilus assembly protein PilY1
VQLEINWRERVTDLRNLETVRDQIEAQVDALSTPSWTPLGAAFAEASRYLYGMQPDFNGGAPSDYGALVVTDPTAGSSTVRYKTPILDEDECSANYIFLLTDGEPSRTANVKGNVDEIIGTGSCTSSTNTSRMNWDCMKKLAEYNISQDNRIGKPIRTNTVLLGPDSGARSGMEEVAVAGQGSFYEATGTAALVNAISRTIDDAASRSGTISAPGVAVNQINRISHLDQLYYAVFKPDVKYRWDGNLKRYRLDVATSSIVDNTSPTPLAAINPDTGLFNEGTKSFWSDQPDGAQAIVGGAASKLPTPENRKMFTYLGSLGSTNVNLDPITFGTAFNTSAKTAMGLSNSTADDVKFKNLINWYKGYAISDLTTLANVSSSAIGIA